MSCIECILVQARSLPFLYVLPIAVTRSSSGGVTQSQGEGAILEVFFPNDNALYSIAFWTHTKTAEPIDMPFWMKTRVGSRNDGGADSPSGRGNLRGLSGHSKALTIFAAAVAVTEIIQSPITSRSSRQKGSVSNQYDKQVQIVF